MKVFMITAVLNIAIPLFALSSLIAVVYFFGRAFSSRMKATKEKYSVGEFERYRDMKLDIMRGVAAAIVGLILLSAYGVMPRSTEIDEPELTATAVPTATTPVLPSPTVTAIIVPTIAPGTAVVFPTVTPSLAETTAAPAGDAPVATLIATTTAPIATVTPSPDHRFYAL